MRGNASRAIQDETEINFMWTFVRVSCNEKEIRNCIRYDDSDNDDNDDNDDSDRPRKILCSATFEQLLGFWATF